LVFVLSISKHLSFLKMKATLLLLFARYLKNPFLLS